MSSNTFYDQNNDGADKLQGLRTAVLNASKAVSRCRLREQDAASLTRRAEEQLALAQERYKAYEAEHGPFDSPEWSLYKRPFAMDKSLFGVVRELANGEAELVLNKMHADQVEPSEPEAEPEPGDEQVPIFPVFQLADQRRRRRDRTVVCSGFAIGFVLASLIAAALRGER